MKTGSHDAVDETVARMLDRVELEEAPEDLQANVLRAIGPRPEPARRRGWFEALRAGVGDWMVPRLAPFAVGAAAGLVVAVALASGNWGGAGRAPLEGAMAPRAAREGGWSRVDGQRFELGRANVRFEVLRDRGRIVVSVTTQGAESLAVTLRLPEGARVERLAAVPGLSGAVEHGPGWVRVRPAGDDRTDIELATGAGAAFSIPVTLESSAGTVIETVLHGGAAGAGSDRNP